MSSPEKTSTRPRRLASLAAVTAAMKPRHASNCRSASCPRPKAVNGDDLRLGVRAGRRPESNYVEAWGDRSAWSISQGEVEASMLAMQRAGYANGSTNRAVSTLGSLYKRAKAQRLTPQGFRSPTLGVARLPETVRRVTFTEAQIAKLRARSLAFPDRRFGPYVHLLLDTGARKGEVRDRRWSDFDLDALTVTLPAESSKTGRARVLYFGEATAALLRRIFPTRSPEAMPFEGRQRGKGADFKKSWANLIADCGIEDMHQHDMRHHKAAELLRQGTPTAVAAQILGHTSGRQGVEAEGTCSGINYYLIVQPAPRWRAVRGYRALALERAAARGAFSERAH